MEMAKKLAIYVIIAIMLLSCIPVIAESVQSIVWTTERGIAVLASTPDGVLPTIYPIKTNNVKVTFSGDTTDYATLIVVPAEGGAAEEPTPENSVVVEQAPVTDGVAEFEFELKQPIDSGVYAAHIGGVDAEYVTGYFYVGDRSIEWTANGKPMYLSDTPGDTLSVINLSMDNNLKVYFTDGNVEYASVIIVPVEGGTAEEPTPENSAVVMQVPVTDGVAEFNFQLKSSSRDGVYVLYTGGTGIGYLPGYFEVNDKMSPVPAKGQILQYDDYKDGIELKLIPKNNTGLEKWAADKESINVKLSNGEQTVTVDPEHIGFSFEDETMLISTLGCVDVIPAFGSPTESITDMEITISTPGYWFKDELGGTIKSGFKLVMPEFSSDGFKEGVPFRIDLYSEDELTGANAIVALYDGGSLVDFTQVDDIAISAGETKTIPITMQSDNLAESGKFSLKVLLWNGFSAEPLTSFVLFP